MRCRSILLFGLAALLLFASPSSVRGQTAIEVNLSEEYAFGGQIVFRASFSPAANIIEATVFIQVEGQEDTIVAPAEVASGEAIYTLDPARQPVRAFTHITYWFRLIENGQALNSEPRTFFYEDNRFEWQVAEAAPFRVHWYEGDAAFGQMLLDTARQGLERAQRYLPVTLPVEVNLYAYASAAEMQSTLQLGGIQWVAGHADPDLALMVVSLPMGPSQRFEARRQIPHELMHILLYGLTGDVYEALPAWLNEGLASINELEANPDYYTLLARALEKDSLIPIAHLCENFPLDASNALLAYAEAASFTRYLLEQFGASGLNTLLDEYRNGIGCERGVETAFGASLADVEAHWRLSILEPAPAANPWARLAPWAVVMIVALGAPFVMALAGLRKPAARREGIGG